MGRGPSLEQSITHGPIIYTRILTIYLCLEWSFIQGKVQRKRYLGRDQNNPEDSFPLETESTDLVVVLLSCLVSHQETVTRV